MPGDATGIGPERCARVLSDARPRDAARLVVVGGGRVLEQDMPDAGVAPSWHPVESIARVDRTAPDSPVLDPRSTDPSILSRGETPVESDRLTGETLAHAVESARRAGVDAITSAPLNKAAPSAGGWRFPDEHKMFAHPLGHRVHFAEPSALDDRWMSRVTGHLSPREALDAITAESIADAIDPADRTVRRAGFAAPRVAAAALSPHAGEGGLFGRDEIEVIAPAVAAAAARGTCCRGPFPADTVHPEAFAGEYDGVVAMYHDRGRIAAEPRGFDRGVTVTAGLGTVFTTPAHGTAFDIVGEGIAATGALERAVRLARRAGAADPPGPAA